MLSAFVCMGFSSFYHLFFVRSKYFFDILQRLDYAGISILIFGSAVAPLHYSYSCKDSAIYREIFMTFLFVSCLSAFVVSILPQFAKPELKGKRAGIFIACGLSTVVPCVHNILNSGWNQILPLDPLPYIIGGVFYITGAVLYGVNVPERCKPGTFCIVGSSHQIFHICVFMGSILHYYANFQLFLRRQHFSCPAQ